MLFPITFAIHFAEEYWAGEGYPAYLFRLRGVELSTTRFVVFQILGFVLFVAAGVISKYLKFPEFMIVVLGGLVLSNGLSHSITALWDGGYGPGLFSSIFLWIPLGVLALFFYVWPHLSQKTLHRYADRLCNKRHHRVHDDARRRTHIVLSSPLSTFHSPLST